MPSNESNGKQARINQRLRENFIEDQMYPEERKIPWVYVTFYWKFMSIFLDCSIEGSVPGHRGIPHLSHEKCRQRGIGAGELHL